MRTIDYLGHVTRLSTLEVACHYDGWCQWTQSPRKAIKVKSFFGLCNALKRIVTSFASITLPLNYRLLKEHPLNFELIEKEFESIKSLQKRLISRTVSAPQYVEWRTRIGTAACDVQVGSLLSQEELDNTTKPIGDWSRSVKIIKSLYDTKEEAYVAIVCAVVLRKPYLEDS